MKLNLNLNKIRNLVFHLPILYFTSSVATKMPYEYCFVLVLLYYLLLRVEWSWKLQYSSACGFRASTQLMVGVSCHIVLWCTWSLSSRSVIPHELLVYLQLSKTQPIFHSNRYFLSMFPRRIIHPLINPVLFGCLTTMDFRKQINKLIGRFDESWCSLVPLFVFLQPLWYLGKQIQDFLHFEKSYEYLACLCESQVSIQEVE